jgi:hypothetical protein
VAYLRFLEKLDDLEDQHSESSQIDYDCCVTRSQPTHVLHKKASVKPVASQTKAQFKDDREEEEEEKGDRKLDVQRYMMFDADESEKEEVKQKQWTPYESKKVYTFSAQAKEEEKEVQEVRQVTKRAEVGREVPKYL